VNPFTHHKRGGMNDLRVAKIYAKHGGHCASCGRKLMAGDDYEIDHKIALANGGTDDDDNLQLLCEGCHILKTGNDVSDAAKGKRRYRKHVVPGRFKPSRWGR
jgi:5-methylcytosine-specific restriction endonuclease McrA